MIDLEFLTKLMDGNEVLANRFVDVFKDQAPRQMLELKLQIKAQDFQAISNTAHSLKTQFNYLNLKSHAEQMASLELMAEEMQWDGMEDLMQEMETKFGIFFKGQ